MQEQDRRAVWAFVFVLGVLALELSWLIFIGPAKGYPGYAAYCEKDCQIPWYWSAVAWTCIFTGFLTVSTGFLWKETRRLAKDADEQHRATERAFLYLDGCELAPVPSVGPPSHFNISVKCRNNGSTPTRFGKSHVSWQQFPTGDPEATKFPDISAPGMTQQDSQMAIGPGGFLELEQVTIPFAEVFKPGRVFVWGWADYNDVFNGTARHRMEFCWDLVIVSHPNGTIRISLHCYKLHNGYDDECYRPPTPYKK